MDGNSPQHNQEMRRNSTIVLAVVIAANLAYWGYRWATHETYESCLVQAAKSANGVPRAYADLRDICDDREFERLIEKSPPSKLSTK